MKPISFELLRSLPKLESSSDEVVSYIAWLLTSASAETTSRNDLLKRIATVIELLQIDLGLAIRDGAIVLLDENESNRQPRIRISYEKVTPGNEDDDEPEIENGWENEEGELIELDEFDLEDGTDIVDKTAQWLKEHYIENASSSHFHPGVWYISSDSDQDYHTGARTQYSFHLEDFTPQEEEAIFQRTIATSYNSPQDTSHWQRWLLLSVSPNRNGGRYTYRSFLNLPPYASGEIVTPESLLTPWGSRLKRILVERGLIKSNYDLAVRNTSSGDVLLFFKTAPGSWFNATYGALQRGLTNAHAAHQEDLSRFGITDGSWATEVDPE